MELGIVGCLTRLVKGRLVCNKLGGQRRREWRVTSPLPPTPRSSRGDESESKLMQQDGALSWCWT